jgi:hypothetical protein
VRDQLRTNSGASRGYAMLSSSQLHDAENSRPVEAFRWTEDASVTEGRRRRARSSRILAWASIVSAVALVVGLYQARIVAFGPNASAAYVQDGQR